MFFLGCIAFALFFLSDYNDAKCRLRGLVFCFPLGFVLLVLAIVFQLDGEPTLLTMPWRIAVLGMFACFLGLLAYTLFFAFPASSAYGSPGQKRPVCDRGVYALCRHPGVL